MQAIVFDEHGDESVLRWDTAPEPRCGVDEVLLRVTSTAVNRADLLQRQGFYPPPPGASEILGLEAAGTLVEVGASVAGWKAGDEAMALLAGGGYAERVVLPADHLLPIPKPISLEDAGAIPEVWLTAYLNLIELARLEAGQRVLIHGGSGGVGTAAIQIAREAGAEVWTTAGSGARCERCQELGAHVAVNYREEDFGTRLLAAGGADVILDILGAKYLKGNLKALKKDGRLVIIGLQGGAVAKVNLGLLLGKRLTIVGSTLRGRSNTDKAGIIARFRAAVWPGLDDGTFVPVIDRRLPLTDAAGAHRVMVAGEQFGKILLTALLDGYPTNETSP